MTTVRCGENESVESALKRFKRKCQKDGIIGDLKKKTEYVKPSVEDMLIVTDDVILSSGLQTNESNAGFNMPDEVL